MSSENDKFLKVGIKAAKEAGGVLISFWGEDKSAVQKNDHFSDIVTKADLESEKKIISVIKQEFPGHSFYSEEKGMENNSSEYLWVVDPLDGTPGFASGLENFGISIGLLFNQKPLIGIIYLPVFDKLFVAMKGGGAFLNNKIIKMDKSIKLKDSLIAFDYGYADKNKKISETLMKVSSFLRYPLTFGSASFSLSCLADNKIQGYVFSCPAKFDIAAGSLIVEEAGGKVSDFLGREIDWSKDETTFLACCSSIHEDLIKTLKID